MAALFELAAEFRALTDRLNELELDAQTIADTLDGASGDLEEKIINTAKYFRNEEAEADAIADAIKQMHAREKTKRKHAENINKYLADQMDRAGKTKVNSPWFVVSVAQNPASVIVDDESLIPDDYMREIPASYSPDKKLIKSAMDEGYVVPGCHLERATSIRIK